MKHKIIILLLISNLAIFAQQSDPVYLSILGKPSTFAGEFKPMPRESNRQISFSALLYTLNTDTAALRKNVEEDLDSAESSGYPVLLKLDDWNFNSASSDSDMVEWTGWPAQGHKYGHPVDKRWINWGEWFWVETPGNFESIKFRKEIECKLVSVIIPPIVARLKKWRAENREYLFAGIVVGWETGYYNMKGYGTINLNPLPAYKNLTYKESDEINTGYAALSSRGYTRDSVKHLSSMQNKSEEQVIHDLMTDVAHDYAEFWARICCQNGIPRERIYTHFTAVSSIPESKSPLPFIDGRIFPLKAAVNEYSRPGVTATDYLIDIDTVSHIFNSLNHKEWGAVELDFSDSTRTEKGAAQILGHLTDKG
ncbi:MAG: hypothetical protein P4L45_05190, partial [Ignavibacteriaceae bacterium]|nr:hypothetical protein [Ignavibacteriaceae bacterium]